MTNEEYRKKVSDAAHDELHQHILELAPENPDYRHSFYVEQIELERFNKELNAPFAITQTYVLQYMGDSCDEKTLYVIKAHSEQEARELASKHDRPGKWDKADAYCLVDDMLHHGILAVGFSGC